MASRWDRVGVLLLLMNAFLLNGALSLDVQGKPADQSTDRNSQGADRAVDGDMSTISHTEDGDSNPWWRLDLQAVYCLQKITIITRMDQYDKRLNGAEVRAGLSPDHSPNTLIGTVDYSTSDNGARVITSIADPVATARYVRVDLPSGKQWLQLGEVKMLRETKPIVLAKHRYNLQSLPFQVDPVAKKTPQKRMNRTETKS